MPSMRFAERAKAFRDAFLAERTASILERIESESPTELDGEEKGILSTALKLVDASTHGFMATQGKPAEAGFLPFADCLSNYRVSFSAMMHEEMVKTVQDISRVLEQIAGALKSVSRGERPSEVKDAARFFRAFSAIRSEDALDPVSVPPQRLPDLASPNAEGSPGKGRAFAGRAGIAGIA